MLFYYCILSNNYFIFIVSSFHSLQSMHENAADLLCKRAKVKLKSAQVSLTTCCEVKSVQWIPGCQSRNMHTMHFHFYILVKLYSVFFYSISPPVLKHFLVC